MSKLIEPAREGNVSLPSPFALELGGALEQAQVHFAMYGSPNAARDNIVLVCHALSGSARVGDWWPQLFGPGLPFDPEVDCILCVNVIGSCYGSTGPTSINANTGQPYGTDFPVVTIRDTVRAQAAVLDYLGIERVRTVIGGSIGGMQAIQFAIDYPERVERCVAIGSTRLSAMGLALNHLQRELINLDLRTSDSEGRGLALARGLAMLSYKSAELLDERFARKPNRSGEDPLASVNGRYDVAGYVDYQGQIFLRRFDPHTYVALTKAMDVFDFARAYGSDEAALSRIRAEVLLIGISSDWLFPAADVRTLADQMTAAGVKCTHAEVVSAHGHDAFLAEPDKFIPLLRDNRARRSAAKQRQIPVPSAEVV